MSEVNVKEMMDSLDAEELCKYCSYNSDCDGDVRGGPNNPIYPPCADGLDEDYFDLEAYLSDMEGQMETKIPHRFPVLHIRDKIFGNIHTYGTDSNDSLMLDENGNVMYYNLQNGEGTGECGGYEFVYTPDEGGYNGIKEVYSEWDSPRDNKKYDEMSKEELIWQCLVKDLQIRELLKAGVSDET